MDVKSWFKSSIKRYFEIDDDSIETEKNKAVGLRETYNLDDFLCSSHTGDYEYNLPSIYGDRNHRFGDSGFGLGEKRSRYSKNDNGVYRWRSHANGRTQFFINEVRNHYANNLDNDVYSPLTGLTIEEPGYDFPVWRRRLGRPNRIDESFLNIVAVEHLTIDSPHLLTEIREYQMHYEQYLKKIESLPRTIDSIVKSKFIEHGIYPTISDNYHNIGYYHFGDLAFLLEQVWDNYLYYIDDFESYRTNNTIVTRSYKEKNDILYLDSIVIGNGNDNMKDRMRVVLNCLPQNRKILNALRDLHYSRLDLDRRVNLIQTLANPFHTQIIRGEYRTLCSCCPTHNPSIWDFN